LRFLLSFVGGKGAVGRQHDGSYGSRLIDPPRAAPAPKESVLRNALDHHPVGLVAAQDVEGLSVLADVQPHVAVEAGGGTPPEDEDVAQGGLLLGNAECQRSTLRLVLDEWTVYNLKMAVLGSSTAVSGADVIQIFDQCSVSGAIKFTGTSDLGPKYEWPPRQKV
jgi:hypothetical protein